MNNQDRKEWIDSAVEELLSNWQVPIAPGIENLKKSISYSYSRGGKRFRPLLALLVAETFAVHPQRVLPWALALEMIHTYSLIHDDLPCMDNDDFRRGEPTNHKVYGETTALLAGDALLTEAFGHLATSYGEDPQLGLRLVGLLSQAAGLAGMVGGQAIDLEFHEEMPTRSQLEVMHRLKTGALIRASAEGAALICGLPAEKTRLCREFGESLGLAFQIQDDLLDSVETDEPGSFPAVEGHEKAKEFLLKVSDQAQENLRQLGVFDGPLFELLQFNLQRKK